MTPASSKQLRPCSNANSWEESKPLSAILPEGRRRGRRLTSSQDHMRPKFWSWPPLPFYLEQSVESIVLRYFQHLDVRFLKNSWFLPALETWCYSPTMQQLENLHEKAEWPRPRTSNCPFFFVSQLAAFKESLSLLLNRQISPWIRSLVLSKS